MSRNLKKASRKTLARRSKSGPGSTPGSERFNSLKIYLTEIRNLKPYTPEEEVELAQRAKSGDQEAIHDLIIHNLRFVVVVAKKFQNHGLPLEDLINEGNLGLIKAVQRYDETRGFRFISYAVWWITQSIRQAITHTGRTIRLPSNVSESIGKMLKQSNELEQAYEREPTLEELAEITHKTLGEIDTLVTNYQPLLSIDEAKEDSSRPLETFLRAENGSPEAGIMKESIHYEIRRILHTLDEREEYIITRYFGLDNYPPKTLDEIGEEINLSRERVRQIKEKGLQRLRFSTRSHLLRIYLS